MANSVLSQPVCGGCGESSLFLFEFYYSPENPDGIKMSRFPGDIEWELCPRCVDGMLLKIISCLQEREANSRGGDACCECPNVSPNCVERVILEHLIRYGMDEAYCPYCAAEILKHPSGVVYA